VLLHWTATDGFVDGQPIKGLDDVADPTEGGVVSSFESRVKALEGHEFVVIFVGLIGRWADVIEGDADDITKSIAIISF